MIILLGPLLIYVFLFRQSSRVHIQVDPNIRFWGYWSYVYLFQIFSSYTPGTKNVKSADGSFSSVFEKGLVPVSPFLFIKYVLHVPSPSYKLLSISKLTKDFNCQIIFCVSHYKFQDLNLRKMIGAVKEDYGLYLFFSGSDFARQDKTTCFSLFLFVIIVIFYCGTLD